MKQVTEVKLSYRQKLKQYSVYWVPTPAMDFACSLITEDLSINNQHVFIFKTEQCFPNWPVIPRQTDAYQTMIMMPKQFLPAICLRIYNTSTCSIYITGSVRVQHCVNGYIAFQRKTEKFDPSQNQKPLAM